MSDASSSSICTIFTDGGGEKSSSAAAAAIVDIDGVRNSFAAFLGPATNNEAEIFGIILGLAALKQLAPTAREFTWLCDSEYALKSATAYSNTWLKNGWKTASKKPVKNQSLWRSYLKLRGSIKVSPQHVYGHTGHPENEACDSAATWLRKEGVALLSRDGQGKFFMPQGVEFSPWQLLDARPLLEEFRLKEGSEVTLDLLEELASLLRAPSEEEASKLESSLGVESGDSRYEKLRNELECIVRKARNLGGDKAVALAASLDSVLAEHK